MKFSALISTAVLILVAGCTDIFEKDLANESIVIIAPIQDKELASGTIQFWWQELKDARTYHLMIVKGSFADPDQVIVDTTLERNNYDQYLLPGSYEWSLYGANNGSETKRSVLRLYVDSTNNLQGEDVVLIQPASDGCVGGDSVLFHWVELTNPNIKYTIDVRMGEFALGQTIYIYETTSNKIWIPISNDFEGELSWGVRATNDESATMFNTRNFRLDNTPPDKPAPILPMDGDTLGTTVDFQWSGSSVTGCTEVDTLYVFSDSTLNSPIMTIGLTADLQAYTATFSDNEYWWFIRRFDGAGNMSSYSQLRHFYVGQ